jgi:hypothetical protein
MTQKSPHYLGMTGTQIGILAGLAAVGLLIMCATAWMFFSTSLPASVPSNPSTAPGQIPSTLPETSAPTVAITPELAMTTTPAGTLVPPGDWVKFEGSGAVIWLPDSFVGGDVIKHKSEVVKKIRNIGPMFYGIADGLNKKKLPPDMVLMMLDSKSDATLIVTSVTVHYKTLESDTTLQKYIDTEFSLVTPIPTINGIKKLTIQGFEARRMVSQQHNGTYEFTDVAYYLKDGNNIWTIDYTLAPAEYMQMLPFVENSIKTFYLVK